MQPSTICIINCVAKFDFSKSNTLCLFVFLDTPAPEPEQHWTSRVDVCITSSQTYSSCIYENSRHPQNSTSAQIWKVWGFKAIWKVLYCIVLYCRAEERFHVKSEQDCFCVWFWGCNLHFTKIEVQNSISSYRWRERWTLWFKISVLWWCKTDEDRDWGQFYNNRQRDIVCRLNWLIQLHITEEEKK